MTDTADSVKRWVCWNCGYDLTVPTGNRCPECGRGVAGIRVPVRVRRSLALRVACPVVMVQFLLIGTLLSVFLFTERWNPVQLIFVAIPAIIFFLGIPAIAVGVFRQSRYSLYLPIALVSFLAFCFLYASMALAQEILFASVLLFVFGGFNTAMTIGLWHRLRRLKAMEA